MADVVIVGGGPAGLNAALLLGRARRDVLLVDAGSGRNETARHVHNLLTRDGIAPGELRKAARADLERYPTVRVMDSTVTSIAGSQGDFTVDLSNGVAETARRVLLATGVVDELPDIEGLAELWGRSVLHCPYCHGFEVCDQPLAVLLTDFFGITTAVRLAGGFSSDVVACADGRFTLDEGQRGMLDRAGVRVLGQRLERLDHVDGSLRGLVFADGAVLERAALFVHPHTRQASPLAAELGCTVLDDNAIEVGDTQQTSVPGIYAAGDMAHRPAMPFGREQVGIAAATGLSAAIFIDQELTFAD